MNWRERVATALIVVGCSVAWLFLRLAGVVHPEYRHYEKRFTEIQV